LPGNTTRLQDCASTPGSKEENKEGILTNHSVSIKR
jgi:hypothetical protein